MYRASAYYRCDRCVGNAWRMEAGALALKRGALLQPDGTATPHFSKGDVLSLFSNLLLYEEEVPREGFRITRQRRMARSRRLSVARRRLARPGAIGR